MERASSYLEPDPVNFRQFQDQNVRRHPLPIVFLLCRYTYLCAFAQRLGGTSYPLRCRNARVKTDSAALDVHPSHGTRSSFYVDIPSSLVLCSFHDPSLEDSLGSKERDRQSQADKKSGQSENFRTAAGAKTRVAAHVGVRCRSYSRGSKRRKKRNVKRCELALPELHGGSSGHQGTHRSHFPDYRFFSRNTPNPNA